MNENLNRFIGIFTKILSVIILMGVAVFLFINAPYFKPTETFKKGVMRLVVDDKDVTNSLPSPVYIEDDIVMMSDKTAMKFFSNVYIYYDKKYDTVIITSEKRVGKIKLGENTINVNGVENQLKGTAKIIDDELYIPISSIEDVTEVEIDFNEKVIATTPLGWARSKQIVVAGKHKLKAYKRELSLTTGVAYDFEKLYIFDTEGKEIEDYLIVRNERGDLGYYQYGKIEAREIVEMNQGTRVLEVKNMLDQMKYSIVWEYAQNGTPNRTGQTKINGLHIISPTWIELKDSNAELRNTIDRDYINWAKGQKYKLWPTVKNDYINMEDISVIMNDMKLREKLISNILNIALLNEFEGINIDFENMYKADKDLFSQFIRELSAILRANGIISSVDVTIAGGSDTYSLCYDRTAIGKAADFILLMAYDQYGSWSSTAGPTASLSWVESNIKEMLGYENVSKDKLILCVPFYSRYWTVNSETDKIVKTSAISMEQANSYLEKFKDKAVWLEKDGQYYVEYPSNNGTTTKIWIENEESLKKKIELINEYDLAGVAAWRWGYEDGNKSWKVIADTMNER